MRKSEYIDAVNKMDDDILDTLMENLERELEDGILRQMRESINTELYSGEFDLRWPLFAPFVLFGIGAQLLYEIVACPVYGLFLYSRKKWLLDVMTDEYCERICKKKAKNNEHEEMDLQ